MLQKHWKTVSKLLLIALLVAFLPAMKASAATWDDSQYIIDVGGSTTVYPIMNIVKSQWPVLNPDYSITLWQIDSGGGRKALMGNAAQSSDGQPTVDIAMASSACSGGDAGPNYNCGMVDPTIIGMDGLSIIVNSGRSCPTNIVKADIAKIYNGTITDWSSFGCPAAAIHVRSREIGSGTRSSLCDMLKNIGGNPNDATATCATEETVIGHSGNSRVNGNQGMEDAVKADVNSIGYAGLHFTSDVNALTVDGVAATETTVGDGSYHLGRNLYLMALNWTNATGLPAKYKKDKIQSVINYLTSPAGQAAVQLAGYVPNGAPNNSKVAPIWDVNSDGTCDVLDVSTIGNFWGLDSGNGDPAKRIPGWLRADVNQDGMVNVLDVSTVGNFWNSTTKNF